MKKTILILFTTVFLINCSPDYVTDASNNNNSQITPPEWIQGTWVDKDTYEITGLKLGFVFKTDDICQLNSSVEVCWKESVNLTNSPNSPYSAIVEQEITDITYKCSITVISQTVHYNFKKVNSITIKNIDNGAVYTKIN